VRSPVARTGSLLLVAILAGAVPAAPQEPASPAPARPRLALALSGGGARGIAHIGALRALEEAGIPVDAIAGNSMGAVVGSIYASGRNAAELQAIVLSLDWASLFSGRPDRRYLPVARREDRFGSTVGIDFDWKGARLPGGLLSDHRIGVFLIEQLAPAGYAAGGDFDRLAVPFRCVATALDNGERVVLARGDLARAVRASMSIPLVFPPVDWNGRPLVDGMVVDNLPVDVAREFGAAVVVAVDIGSPDLEPAAYENALGVAAQVSSLLMNARNQAFAAKPDVYVRPDLGTHSAADYSGFETLIARGYEATKRAIPEIRRRLEAAAEAGGAASRPRPAAGPQLAGTPIAEVRIEGNQRLSESLLRRLFNIPVGPPFSLPKSLRALEKILATRLLSQAWMKFEPAPGGLRIVLQVREAPPNRAEVSVGYDEAGKARGAIRLFNRNTLGFGEQTELLLAGSDATTGGELSLQGDRLFVPGLGYKLTGYAWDDKPPYYDAAGVDVNRARFERLGFDARLQVAQHRWGLLEAGFRLGRVHTVPRSGIDLPEATDQVRTLLAGFTFDDLDDLTWPEAGFRAAADSEWNLKSLGGTWSYWRLRTELRGGWRLNRRLVLQTDALAGLSTNDLPAYDWFRIGGPTLIPGYHMWQLYGPQALAASATVRYRVAGPLRVFLRAGAGNVWAHMGDISTRDLRWGVGGGAMVPTKIGPISAELGARDGGDVVANLSIGWN